MSEQVRNAITPDEMRAELHRLQYYDSLIHAVMTTSDYRGISSEDRYTLLAYHAIKALHLANERLLQDAMTRITPMFVTTTAVPKEIK